MTDALRSLAAELDELGSDAVERVPEIPDFRLTDVLGRGGMGTVYLAVQTSLGREVALKVMRSTGESIPNEAQTVAQLHHPNIVHVYAAGTIGGQSWFAMELMRGKNASHGNFASVEDVAGLGVQIAEALAYAHRCGVVHRDVKPSNIFIDENGLAKLGDFGLANSLGEGGTRRYMAPELIASGRATETSDQYALGVTLQELAGSRVPRDHRQTCPDFSAICARATAQDPSRRYESMAAMLDDLRRLIARRPVAANPPSPLRRCRLFARRNPLAAAGILATTALLAALTASLAVGYVRTSRALAATEREAASAAQSLAKVVAGIDRTDSDKRGAEIAHALTAAESLAARFPGNAEIADSVDKLKAARDAHARFLERRGGAMRLQHRFRPIPRRGP